MHLRITETRIGTFLGNTANVHHFERQIIEKFGLSRFGLSRADVVLLLALVSTCTWRYFQVSCCTCAGRVNDRRGEHNAHDPPRL